MEERPDSIEISTGDGISPWGDSSISESDGNILSGDVSSFGDQEGAPFWKEVDIESKGLSNGAWFLIGMIPMPIAMWFTSFLLLFLAESVGSSQGVLWEFFYTISWLVWPVGLIGGLIWSFTRGNKYFAFGLVTTLVGLPAVLFLAVIVFLFSIGVF